MSNVAAPLEGLPLAFRQAGEQDVSFLFNSWMTSFRQAPSLQRVAQPFYFNGQHKLIERILAQSQVLLVVDKDTPHNIYSYIVYEKVEGVLVLHYAYTKQTFRKLGLFKKLLAEAGHTREVAGLYTHESKISKYVGDHVNMYYNPYLLFECLKPAAKQQKEVEIPEHVKEQL